MNDMGDEEEDAPFCHRRPYVDHTYTDLSRYFGRGGKIIKHKKSGSNFPAQLHQILSEHQFAHIITWQPHGRAWKILNKQLLMSVVVPKYLRQTKFESFTRQLSGWGFKRLHRSGVDFGCYYHESFLRGIPKLTGLMARMPKKQGKPTPFAAGEPNFHDICRLNPLPLLDQEESSNSAATTKQTAVTTTRMPMSTWQTEPQVQASGISSRTERAYSSSASSAAVSQATMAHHVPMLHTHSYDMSLSNARAMHHHVLPSAQDFSAATSEADLSSTTSTCHCMLSSFYDARGNSTRPLAQVSASSSSSAGSTAATMMVREVKHPSSFRTNGRIPRAFEITHNTRPSHSLASIDDVLGTQGHDPHSTPMPNQATDQSQSQTTQELLNNWGSLTTLLDPLMYSPVTTCSPQVQTVITAPPRFSPPIAATTFANYHPSTVNQMPFMSHQGCSTVEAQASMTPHGGDQYCCPRQGQQVQSASPNPQQWYCSSNRHLNNTNDSGTGHQGFNHDEQEHPVDKDGKGNISSFEDDMNAFIDGFEL